MRGFDFLFMRVKGWSCHGFVGDGFWDAARGFGASVAAVGLGGGLVGLAGAEAAAGGFFW